MKKNIKIMVNNLASRRIRCISLLIDGTALNCVFLSIPEMFPGVSIEKLVYSGIYPIIFLVYAIMMEYKYQATLGKLICKIRIEARDQSTLTFKQAFLRNASKLIPFEIISALMGRDRIIHDIIANTYVVKSNY